MRGRTITLIVISLLISGFIFPPVALAEETGTLTVTTTPVRGPILVDNIFKSTSFWSGSMNSGDHIVSFGDVSGYITPFPQTVTVMTNQAISVIGVYRKIVSLSFSDPIRVCRMVSYRDRASTIQCWRRAPWPWWH
jgi:hypothetical protein